MGAAPATSPKQGMPCAALQPAARSGPPRCINTRALQTIAAGSPQAAGAHLALALAVHLGAVCGDAAQAAGLAPRQHLGQALARHA